MEFPARYTLTIRDRAPWSKFDHRATQDITRMADACSDFTVGQQPPPWSLEAKNVLATPGTNVHYVVCSMLIEVSRYFAFLHVVPRWLGAGKIRATPAVRVHHAALRMLLAVRRQFAAFNVEAWLLHA